MAANPHSNRTPGPGGERVGARYELVEHIAQGGMGEVYVARELATGKLLALKRLLPVARKRQALFRAEYHALARLKHPYIIEVYDYGVDKELPFYTMELLDGHDLRESPKVTIEEGCRILRDVASSLSLLHNQRLLHRDISPRNVRRTSAGRCKLIDFGTMVPFGVPPNVAGTPPFISPEAREGGLLDQRSDLYSLGALAYWLFSRRLPGSARTIERGPQTPEALPMLRKVAKDVPQELEELVMSLLEFDPSKRPSSAMEVISRLSAIGGLSLQEDSTLLAQSHLVSSSFVGQKRALEAGDKALKRALVCNGGALLVEADEGAGKTRYLQELSLMAQTQGFTVVRAFASRSARGVHVARELYRGLNRAAPDVRERLAPSDREGLAPFDWHDTSRLVAQPIETRARMQWALSVYFRAVSKEGPLIVLVDDIDLSDEFSVAFISALATVAETLPLLIVASSCTVSRREQSSAFTMFKQRARPVALTALDERATRALVSSAFGRVPHRDVLVQFLFREARGNPALTVELCERLLEREVIRYVDGAFVLPESLPVGLLPSHAVDLAGPRLSGASSVAKQLVELLAICRGGASLDLCLAASGARQDEVLSAINELVSRGILMGSGNDYVFAQETVRRSVSNGLRPERARELHERLARAFLGAARVGPLHRLEAGWHLVHTEREQEGAQLLREVTPPLIESGVAYQEAIAGLEKALEVLERTGAATLKQRIEMRTHLARASYLNDYRLADRHAAVTVQLLVDWCNVRLFERLARVMPRTLAVLLTLFAICVRWLFTPSARRGPGPVGSLQCLGRSVVSTMGVRVTSLNGPAAHALLKNMELMNYVPALRASSLAYAAAEALALQPYGRENELMVKHEQALQQVNAPLPPLMSEAERQDIRVGLMLSRGITECYRIGSQALKQADELEAQGTPIARASAHRIRFTYYCVRGMRERSEEYRRELDIHGIQGGTIWQVEWFAVPTEGMAGALLGDLVGTAQALDRLERLAREMPSLEPLRDMVRIGFHLRRGENDLAIEQGARFIAQNPPRTIIGWGPAYAAYAAALNNNGRHAEALALCERALAALDQGDLQYVIMYGPLRREMAVALAGTGQLQEAMARSQVFIDELEAHGEHALLAHAHEVRARVARMFRNHTVMAQALVAMRDAAEQAGSTTVIEQAAKVTQASLRATHEIELAPSHDPSWDSHEHLSDQTPAGGVAMRGRSSLLRRVMQRAKARSALVFSLDREGALKLLHTLGDVQMSDAVRALVEPALERAAQADQPQPLGRGVLGSHSFELLSLPREPKVPPIVLLLLRDPTVNGDLPNTLLERLAEQLKSELVVPPSPSDSMPDSDFAEPLG